MPGLAGRCQYEVRVVAVEMKKVEWMDGAVRG